MKDTAQLRNSAVKALKTCLVAAFSIVIVSLGILGPTLALISTSWGRLQIVKAVNGIDGIAINGLEGDLLSALQIVDFRLSDADGIWLEIPVIDVEWEPASLVRRTVHFTNINLPKIDVKRTPTPTPRDSTPKARQPFKLNDITDLPISILLETLQVDEVIWRPEPLRSEIVTLRGRLSLKRRQELDAVVRLTPEQADKSDDEIDATLFLNTQDALGSLKLNLTASKEGLIAALAGLPDRTVATVAAEGRTTDWEGTALATIGEVNVADLSANYREARGLVVGQLDVTPFVGASPTDLLSKPLNVKVDMTALEKGATQLNGTIGHDAAALDLNGTIDFNDGTLSAQDLRISLAASGLVGPAKLQDLVADFVIEGDVTAAEIDYAIKTNRVETAGIAIVGPMLAGSANQSAEGLVATLSGTIADVTGIEGISAPVLSDLKLTGNASVPTDPDAPPQAALAIENQTFRLALTEVKERSDGSTAFRASLTAQSLEPLPGAIPAALDTDALVALASDGQISLDVTGKLTPEQSKPHWISRLSSDFLSFDLVGASQDGFVRLEALTLESDRLEARADATLSADRIDANVDGTLASSSFADLTGGATDKPARISLTASGPIDTAMPLGTIEIPALAAANLLFADLVLSLTRDTADPDAVKIELNGKSNEGAVDSQAIIRRLPSGRIEMPSLKATLGNVKIAGSAALPGGEDAIPEADVSLTLSPAPPNTNGFFDLSGILEINAQLGRESPGLATVSGDGSAIRYGPTEAPILDLGRVSLNGSADLNANDLSPSATLTAKIIQVGGLFLDAVTADVEVSDAAPGVKLLIEQFGAATTALEIDSTLRTGQNATEIETALSGMLGGAEVSSTRPISIIIESNGVTLTPTEMRFGDGLVELAATQTSDAFDASATVSNFDLAMVSNFLQEQAYQGRFNADFKLSASPREGSLAADFNIKNLSLKDTNELPLGLEGSIRAADEYLSLELSGGAAPRDIRLTGSAPIMWPKSPGTPKLQPTGGISGQLQIDANLAPYWTLSGIEDQLLSGQLRTDIDIDGSFEAPELDGSATVAGGRYEHLEFGALLEDLTATLTILDNRLTLTELSANDGRGGTLTGRGGLNLATLEPEAASISLGDFQLLAKGDIQARASAALDLMRANDDFLLKGDVTIEEARYVVAQNGAASVPTLPVEDVNSAFLAGEDESSAFAVEPKAAESSFPLRLDIGVAAPRRIFVTGMGLTSEWSTKLSVKGTAREPDIRGQVQVVRGELEFAGKRFNLQRGQIFLDGGTEIEPRLDMLAENTQGDFTARIGITGTPSNPTIDLSSTPSLPTDEILSRILFGSSATDLSALEAVQLGSAVAALSGGGSGALDVAGKARSATGLDRLSLGSAESSTSITGGKYLTEDLYLQFTTDPSSGQYLAAIEWYLTRTLSLLSEYGPQTGSNMAGRWSKNY